MKSLDQVYRRNLDTGAYIIEIKIQKASDLFNDLDPSPFRRRDLDPSFTSYLEESSLDIPLKYPVELEISCEDKELDPEVKDRVRQGVRGYYQFLQTNLGREIRSRIWDSLVYVLVGFLSLTIAFLLGSWEEPFFSEIIIEGFNIGGWVFFWEFLALAAFKSRSQRKELKRLKRLEQGTIKFLVPQK
jgi:hypothetical protein